MKDGMAMNSHVVNNKVSRAFSTKQLVLIGMLSALSYILMLLKLPIAYLGFLEFEFSDIPALVAGFAYGPLTAVVIELIKNLIKALMGTTTGGVGELANFIVSSSYMIITCGLFKLLKNKGDKTQNVRTVIACMLGTITMTIAGGLMNYYVLLPMYAGFMGGMDNIVKLASNTISIIDNAGALVVIGISPFNIFKGIYVSLIGFFLYRVFRKELQNL
ncbi:MAG: ECF transporter S component [Clostridium sp.]|nr:ECF transporter S component [Clostridium sp.]